MPATTTRTITLPSLRPDQAAIVRATETHAVTVVACGRRWGKTLMAGVYAVAAAAQGAAVAWVVPHYANARAAWRLAESWTAGVAVLHRAERMITLGPGRLSIYSADHDVSLRGESFHLAIVDEAAMIAESTYTDALLPTLADTLGRVLLISTPRGRNWFWHEWTRGRAGEPGYISFHAPTAANPNPTIQRAAALARDRIPDRSYRQEWLAEFLEDGGEVFSRVRPLATVPPGQSPDPTHQYVVGVDWGRAQDYTVAVVLDVTASRVVDLLRMRHLPYDTQLHRLLALLDRWAPQVVIAEHNAIGELLIAALARSGVRVRPFVTTHASKIAIIDALVLACERGDLALLQHDALLAELEAFSVRTSPSGTAIYAAPDGMHDDCVMALAIAWSAVSAPRRPSSVGAFA